MPRRCSPLAAPAFLTWFNQKLAGIPPDQHASVKIDIDANGGFDEQPLARICIYHTRMETALEAHAREAKKAARDAELVREEKRQLAALLKKYGPVD